MRRRQILAAVPLLLAGCSRSPTADRRPTVTTTALPETITDCEPTPDPPSDPTAAEAREFVAAFEESRIYNELASQNGGLDECRPDGPGVSADSRRVRGPTEITVEPAATAITAETDAGFYVASSCSGEAEYLCVKRGPGSCSSRSGRNADFVTHFVGDGRHARIPHDWIACRVRDEPHRSPAESENVAGSEEEPGAQFRVCDFESGTHGIDVTLTHVGANEELLAETYEPPYGPAVQTNVTVRRGRYRLEAAAGDERAERALEIRGREDASWDGTCVYRGVDGSLAAVEVATENDLAVPETSCYERHRREADRETAGRS